MRWPAASSARRPGAAAAAPPDASSPPPQSPPRPASACRRGSPPTPDRPTRRAAPDRSWSRPRACSPRRLPAPSPSARRPDTSARASLGDFERTYCVCSNTPIRFSRSRYACASSLRRLRSSGGFCTAASICSTAGSVEGCAGRLLLHPPAPRRPGAVSRRRHHEIAEYAQGEHRPGTPGESSERRPTSVRRQGWGHHRRRGALDGFACPSIERRTCAVSSSSRVRSSSRSSSRERTGGRGRRAWPRDRGARDPSALTTAVVARKIDEHCSEDESRGQGSRSALTQSVASFISCLRRRAAGPERGMNRCRLSVVGRWVARAPAFHLAEDEDGAAANTSSGRSHTMAFTPSNLAVATKRTPRTTARSSRGSVAVYTRASRVVDLPPSC